jgi:hypothetical protein
MEIVETVTAPRIAILCLLLAGSAPEERSACDSLSEAFVNLSARARDLQPHPRSAEEAAPASPRRDGRV